MIYREVKRYAPDDLDTGELALLLILADEADEDTRECFPGMDELCAYMRMGADGIGRILQRLAKRGLEVRVVVDKDKIGRPVYAKRGMRTTYRLPRFAPVTMAGPASGQGPVSPDHSPAKEQAWPDHSPAKSGVRPDCGPSMAGPQSGPSPQFPQEEDPHLLPSQRTLRNAGFKLAKEEETSLIAFANRNGRKGPGWWRTLAANGDLADLIAEWHQAASSGPARDSPAAEPAPKCSTCNEDRLIEDDHGNRAPCPTCHPKRKATP
jgi:hypothetical protein